MTYNDEVACKAKTNLDLTGAVQANSLKAILEKMPDDEVEITAGENEILIKGKRRNVGVRMEHDVLLPFKNVETPKKFVPLHEEFSEAVAMAYDCTSKNQDKFWSTCVHIHPKWIEACDGFKIIRYKMKTNVSQSQLVRGTAIKCITELDVKEFCETDNWIHFRTKDKTVISCRRWLEPYKSEGITKLLEITGTKSVLPKGLAEAAQRAEVFSKENPDNNLVQVMLMPGKLRIKGDGVSGWYSETKKLKYKGPKLDFYIGPELLVNLTQKHNECEVSNKHLKVGGAKFTFVACLNLIGEEDHEEDQREEKQTRKSKREAREDEGD